MSHRKIGADMTNALLWAAFSALVFLSILYLYGTIELMRAKNNATTTISSIISDIRSIQAIQGNYEWIDTGVLIDMGSIPEAHYSGAGEDRRILLDASSTLLFTPGSSFDRFNLKIVWDDDGRIPQAVCAYLSSVENDRVPAGALGQEYEIVSADCGIAEPTLTVTYYR